jgi:hypothetical protein
MGQMDHAETGPPGGGAGTPAMALPHFSILQGTRPPKTKFKITTVETAELAALKNKSRQKQARTREGETIPQEGAKVRMEIRVLQNEMTALKKG